MNRLSASYSAARLRVGVAFRLVFQSPRFLAAAICWFAASSVVCGQSNGVYRELYSGISGSAVANLTGAAAFPNSPSFTEIITGVFETTNNFADNYGQRLRALLLPPTNGTYIFWIASDDGSVLYVSSDESPSNRTQIASLTGSTASRNFTANASQQSTNITLEAGRRYYIEALHKEGTGSDNLAVRWRLPSGTIEEPIPASRMRPFGMPAVSPPAFTSQPTNVTVLENTPAHFRVGVSNLDLVSFQWQRSGTNIPGANGATFAIALPAPADSGATFHCVVTNVFGTNTSVDATLTVLTDTNAPTLFTVANLNSNTVQVLFSEPVEIASATNRLNYSLDNGATVTTVAFGSTTRTLHLTMSPLLSGASYTLTVSNVRDRAATPNTIAANSAQTFTALLKGIFREVFTSIGGNFLIDLTNSPGYPNGATSAELMTNAFETPSNSADSFGQRLRARLIAPQSGAYFFWLAADENATLFLGTNDSPSTARAIATSSTAPPRSWDSATNQKSAPITLAAGQRYYVETLMKEAVGNDNLAVRWQLPDGTIEEPIPIIRLTPFGMNPPLITASPTNVSTVEGSAAVFTVSVSNIDRIAYQWQRNGLNISSATNAAYTNAAVTLADHLATYLCLLANPVGATNSVSATLNVLADTTPPALANVLNSGATNVIVFFTEPVETASATNKLNYSIPGVTFSTAALRSDNRSVTLPCPALTMGSNYTITVSNVRDRATTPNNIAPGSSFTFLAANFFPQDVGTLSLPTSFTVTGHGVDVTAAGSDIGGTNDQFSFSYQLRSGDFDVKVRVARLDFANTWTEAGLMAREVLTTSSRHVSVFATPSLAGTYMEWRTNSTVNAQSAGNFPANYPNTWLRLARAGNAFAGFASYDGATWTQLGAVTSALPATLYLGFGVASHDAAQAVTAQFRDFMNVTNAVLGALPVANEPAGPSTRRSALALTEIMYHPVERADGRSGEFVEIFNSNPFPEDISGYRLSGDIDYTFPAGTTLRAGEYLVVARNVADAQFIHGLARVFGPYANALPNGAGTLRLRNDRDAVLLEINYDRRPPWPAAADGAGHSLVLVRPSWGEGNVKAWGQSDLIGGSPASLDGLGFEPQRNVVINEFLAHTDLPEVDYIELYNHSAATVDLSGCWLSDTAGTNKFRIPDGTMLGATGFVFFTETTLGFSLSSAGEGVYFVNSNQTRVLEAVVFQGQENGVSTGRSPDGNPAFSRLANKTPGASNGPQRADSIVINEIMYNPVSGDDGDEFVELYNRSAAPVSLGGWRFTDGLDFAFATNTTLAPDSYLVVARNVTNLLAKHTNLTPAICVGNFTGSLKSAGEHLALSRPDSNVTTNGSGLAQTNVFFIVMDEVTYGTGGRWGQWSDGGGSSLELIDPRADNRLPSNWADSDDTAKSAWTTVSFTGMLTNGGSTMPFNSLQVYMQDAAEVLIDNVSVSIAGSANLVANGDFENGMTDWFAQGNQGRTSLESTGYLSANSLHVRATARGDTGANRLRTTLTSTYSNGPNGTISAKVKWLHGKPEILFRLRGNHLEAAGTLLFPPNLGTPGARNSRYVTNAGPALDEVVHAPILPAATQPVVVTARVHDPDGIASVQLIWRVDPAGATNTVAMLDNGTGGDAVAGDGVFSATVVGQTSGTMVAFYVLANDAAVAAATTRFPDNAPVREALVRFGEVTPNVTFGTYRAWLTQTNFNRWIALTEKLSNEPFDATFVVGNFRVIYNAGARYAGSPFHSPSFSSPIGANCDYQITLPVGDANLAETDFTLQLPGNGGGDGTGQGQQTAYWIARQLGTPFNYHRFVNMYMQGVKRGTIMEDVQQPSGDHERQWFPDADDGDLYKVQFWFEFNDTSFSPFSATGASLARFLTTGGEKYRPRYRQNFAKRAVQDSASNFTNIFNLVDALSTSATGDAYVATVGPVIDFNEFARAFAVERIVNNTDVYGNGGGQNLYIYKAGSAGKWNTLLWDIDFAFFNGVPTANLFNFSDTPITTLFNHPLMRRTYWQALEDAANGPLVPANMNLLLDAKYDALRASGLSPTAPTSIKTFATARRDYILSLLSTVRAGLTIGNNGGNDFTNGSTVLTLSGLAPISARTITVNGVAYPISWSTISNWSMTLTLTGPANVFNIRGLDAAGNVLTGGSKTITVYFNGPVAAPQDSLVINEIMFNPAVSNASYVEIFNRSTNTTFELGQYRLQGLDLDFKPGTILAPRGYLLAVKNTGAFQSAFGTNVPIAGEFNGNLDPDGETLTLTRTVGTNEFIINQVKYEAGPPWPALAATPGSGAALQLIDAAQDNSRVANWSDGSGWRLFSTNINLAGVAGSRLFAFLDGAGDVFLDDISLVALTGPTAGSNLVQNGAFELPLVGAWSVGTNMTHSGISTAFSHSGGASLHFVAAGAGSPSTNTSLSQEVGAATNTLYALSYWFLPTTNANKLTVRFNSAARPENILRSPGAPYTPGTQNLTAATLPSFPLLWLNELQPENPGGLQDNTGTPQPWLELFNSGTNALTLDGYFLANSYTNINQWAFPTGTVIGPGEFSVIFADGQPGLSTGTVLHTSFRLNPAHGSAVLARGALILDYVNYSNLAAGFSYGSWPDGQLFDRQVFYYVTPGASNNPAPVPVAINEWMASNTRTLLNESGNRYDDWLELHNFGSDPIDLSGYFLTDDLNARTKWRIPDGTTLAPLGFLLVWADGDATGTNVAGGALHASFQLKKGGDELGLFSPAGLQVDAVTFGAQTSDVSQGRFPDGNVNGVDQLMLTTTPRTNNVIANNSFPPVLVAPSNRAINEGTLLTFTNTALDADAPAQTLTFSLVAGAPYGADIDMASGVFIWTPLEAQGGASYPITVKVTDNGLPPRSDTKTFTVTVNKVNGAPLIGVITNLVLDEGTTLSFPVPVVELDLPAQMLSYALLVAPTNADLNAGGVFTWTPTEAQGPSTNMILFSVTDNGMPALATTQSFVIVVNELNQPPTLSGIANQILHQGATLTLSNKATDVDLPPNLLMFSLRNPPPGAAIDPGSGVFTWVPAPAQSASTNSITVVVTDHGSPEFSDEKMFNVIVGAPLSIQLIQLTEGHVQLTWSAIPGRTYRVRYAATLDPPDWLDLPGNVVATGNIATTTDTIPGTTQRFYRIKALPGCD